MKKIILNNKNGIMGATACLFIAMLTLSFRDTARCKSSPGQPAKARYSAS
ncbi:hypothetical protein BH11BAC4_BH11BAC4_24100 [soil metagenome]